MFPLFSDELSIQIIIRMEGDTILLISIFLTSPWENLFFQCSVQTKHKYFQNVTVRILRMDKIRTGSSASNGYNSVLELYNINS